jgi:transposase
MLGLGAATRVFVATGATDMRLGFNGLYALVAGQLKEDPAVTFSFSRMRVATA